MMQPTFRQIMRVIGLITLVVVGSACQSIRSEQPEATATVMPTIAVINTVTPIPTVMIPPTATPTRDPVAINTVQVVAQNQAVSTSTETTQPSQPSISPTPEATATAISTPTITPTDDLRRTDHYWLARPIAIEADRTHWVDRTYPYGSTQLGTREVHLGVEFVNNRFTPILAAASGQVLYAGSDDETQFGPDLNYYGNLVVIAHDFATAEGLPLYTLYGHMNDIEVRTGQIVQRGDRIGRVGSTGIAIGSHLHFEVRAGDPYNYLSTRNPELWIMPYLDHGTLAGRVTGAEDPLNVVIEVRDGVDYWREAYTYAGARANSDPLWNENFVLGDIPAGEYEVFIGDGRGNFLFRERITIEAETTNWIDINLGDE